jgi:hypothetical protein
MIVVWYITHKILVQFEVVYRNALHLQVAQEEKVKNTMDPRPHVLS